jgi:hypothetical protein
MQPDIIPLSRTGLASTKAFSIGRANIRALALISFEVRFGPRGAKMTAGWRSVGGTVATGAVGALMIVGSACDNKSSAANDNLMNINKGCTGSITPATTTVEVGEEVELSIDYSDGSGQGIEGDVDVTWSGGGGTFAQTTTTLALSVDSDPNTVSGYVDNTYIANGPPGTYEVTAAIAAVAGCAADSLTAKITILGSDAAHDAGRDVQVADDANVPLVDGDDAVDAESVSDAGPVSSCGADGGGPAGPPSGATTVGPTYGTTMGGVNTTIGFNFMNSDSRSPQSSNNTVTFGGVPATTYLGFGVLGEVAVDVPTGAQSGPVVITTCRGSTTAIDNFTVSSTAAALITGISPASVSAGGVVTLTGTGLDTATGGILDTNNPHNFSLSMQTATSAQFTVPANFTTHGMVTVGVTGPGGLNVATTFVNVQ